MNKKTIILVMILLFAMQVFAAEFILGEKYARKNGMKADTTVDSSLYVKDTSFYMDSAEVAALEGIRGQTMSGERSRASIMRGIDQNQNTIRKAYNNHIRMGNTLNGGMIVRFKIVPSGEVVDVKILESNTGDVAFEKSVALEIKKWKFPSVKIENDTTIVEYPFVFGQLN